MLWKQLIQRQWQWYGMAMDSNTIDFKHWVWSNNLYKKKFYVPKLFIVGFNGF